jgi:hypothetical protein
MSKVDLRTRLQSLGLERGGVVKCEKMPCGITFVRGVVRASAFYNLMY